MKLTVRLPKYNFELTVEGDNVNLIITTAIYALKQFWKSRKWLDEKIKLKEV